MRIVAAATAFCRESKKPFACEQRPLWRGWRVEESYEQRETVWEDKLSPTKVKEKEGQAC